MHALKRAPQRNPYSHLCTQCRHAHTTLMQKNRVALKNTARNLAERSSVLRARVRSARTARREDWFLGPLAPNRAALEEDYGCLEGRELTGVHNLRLTKQGRSPHMSKEMKWEESLVEVGDRVVVVAGEGAESRERGKVGKVEAVYKGSGECKVQDLNMVDVQVPNYARANDPNSPPIRTVSKPLPLSSVRLVYPLLVAPEYSPDGTIVRPSYNQDTIISKLIRRPGHGTKRWIANSDKALGQWVEVPLPVREQKKKAAEKDQEVDTLRFEVEDKTWIPTLLRAPMPASVVDELRNKYSRYRTRHEPAYQAALDEKQRERAAYKEWMKQGAGGMLLSPAKEARMMEVERLRKKGREGLRREVLERIGEVMANQGIQMTEERRRGLEKNLAGEEVLKGTHVVGDVRGEGEEYGEGEELGEGTESDGEERQLQGTMEEISGEDTIARGEISKERSMS